MKTEIKNLKNNDLFIFNNQTYKVKRNLDNGQKMMIVF